MQARPPPTPTGSFDFPLSRHEKLRRLQHVTELQLELADEEVIELRAKVAAYESCAASAMDGSDAPEGGSPAAARERQARCSGNVRSSGQSEVRFGRTSELMRPRRRVSAASPPTSQAAQDRFQFVGDEGSVSALRWRHTSAGIAWVQCLLRGGMGLSESQESEATGEFTLQPGEYVRVARGRTPTVADGSMLAEWLELITSRGRKCIIDGMPANHWSAVPTFSFGSLQGIVGFTRGPGGLSGVVERSDCQDTGATPAAAAAAAETPWPLRTSLGGLSARATSPVRPTRSSTGNAAMAMSPPALIRALAAAAGTSGTHSRRRLS